MAATIQNHLAMKETKEADLIARSLYVDNLVTGVDSVEQGYQLSSMAIALFGELSMRIRDWNTNSQELWERIPADFRAKQLTTKVLGLVWDTKKDTLTLAVDTAVLKRKALSKREILRIIASIFDPCGLVSPLILSARLFVQQLWVKQYKWDTGIDKELIEQWKQCVQSLQLIPTVTIPRYHYRADGDCVPTASQMKEEFHCFADASQEAYSAVVYLRRVTEFPNAAPNVAIIMSRTRLRPVKQRESMTIPKMELLGVLIGSRLLDYVRRTLNMVDNPSYLWTDSTIVLDWLRSRKLLEPFVSRRVTEIKSYTTIQHMYVSSADNPADLATRVQTSMLPTLWWEGPAFLKSPKSKWPAPLPAIYSCLQPGGTGEVLESSDENQRLDEENSSGNEEEREELDRELRLDRVVHQDNHHTPQTNNTSASAEDPNDNIEQHTPHDYQESNVSFIGAIKTIQRKAFPKEAIGSATALTASLGLFLDDQGLLRCKGRLQNALLPYDQKNPILLPKDDPFTFDIIKKVHKDNYHVGPGQTLGLLRKQFWIPSGRSTVIKVLKKCPQCIKYGGGPYKLPPMPPLPPARVQYCRPFLYTGLDYLGPLTVVGTDSTTTKRWCCIFTCMASRAICLEVVNSQSAADFLLCLRRFVAAHGVPALIVSDNAAQFRLAAEVIESPICKDNGIAWHFIPELAPWHGGFYERLVGLVKHCLRRTLDKNILSDAQLTTTLKEIETILNSRPLTYVGSDLEHILTPVDFLSTCGTHPLPMNDSPSQTPITATKLDLIEGWRKGQHAMTEFKSMFQAEYLACLRERTQTNIRQPRVMAPSTPQEGDIVQILDERSKSTNRAHWKVGKIVSLIPSCDGHIRTAKVRLDSGLILTRSISHLYPLELSVPAQSELQNDKEEDEGHLEPPTGTNENADTNTSDQRNAILPPSTETQTQAEGGQVPSRPRRAAAEAARQVIREWTKALSTITTVSPKMS